MRVGNRLVTLWALTIYAVMAVGGQSLHLWSCHALPAAVSDESSPGACCPGHLATDACSAGESGSNESDPADPSRGRHSHDSQNCAVCQFLMKAPAVADAPEASAPLPLIGQMPLPVAPALVPEFRIAFFSRGPPHA